MIAGFSDVFLRVVGFFVGFGLFVGFDFLVGFLVGFLVEDALSTLSFLWEIVSIHSCVETSHSTFSSLIVVANFCLFSLFNGFRERMIAGFLAVFLGGIFSF